MTLGQHSSLVCVDPNLPVNVQSSELGLLEERGCLFFVRKMLEFFGNHTATVLEGFFSCPPQRSFREQLLSCGIRPDRIDIVGDRVGDFAPYDLVFIDGDHFAEAVHSDLSLVSKYLSKMGTIILHDLSGKWANEVETGVRRFLQEHPAHSITVNDNLGFLKQS